MLDLSDEEGGLKYLHESPARYAHKFLKGREVFVLVKIESKLRNHLAECQYTTMCNHSFINMGFDKQALI